MNKSIQKPTFFGSDFAADLAQTTVYALCERACSEQLKSYERDQDDGDFSDFSDVDLLAPNLAPELETLTLHQVGTVMGSPAAENMTIAEIERIYATGEDPWSVCAEPVEAFRASSPSPTSILVALGMCASVGDRGAVERMFRPGGVTTLVCTSSAMRKRIAEMLVDVIRIWKEKMAPAVNSEVDIHTFESSDGTTSKDIGRKLERFRLNIDESVRRGRGVIVICSQNSPLSLEQKSLVRQTLHFPQLSSSVIIEVLKRTHSQTGRLAEQELLKRLPDSESLRRMVPLQLAAAFSEASTLRVADRLKEIADAGIGPSGVTLENVHGLSEALKPVKRMLDGLFEWREGRAAWSDLTRSCLFYGPPGTGKTLLAKAIAGSAGLPLIATSYSDCQKNGHQGDMLAALADAFERAAQAAPAVLFIDELDSFSKRAGNKEGAQYMRGVVNGLLEQINFASEVEGLILLGASNFLDAIDPAVIRSGRFDLKIEVGYPTLPGLEAILRGKLGQRMHQGLDLQPIAEQLVGQPGATAEALVRDALGRARMDHAMIGQKHLIAAADHLAPPIDPALLERIAVHEAGHALAALLLPLPNPKGAWISPRGGNVELGLVPAFTPPIAKAQLQMLLAGRAGEALYFGEVSSGAGAGNDSDLAQATRIAAAIELNWGFGDSGLLWQNIDLEKLSNLPGRIRHRVREHLDEAYASVTNLLKRHAVYHENLTARLLSHRELGQHDFEQVWRRLHGSNGDLGAFSADMRQAS
jgi:cell division protease FtsH